jgi:alkanesulfonate monooxygenase SsuD/methylene tetrahydromethanopterin reductase-like flavin-dependent oxidoreductase (luciferase family)
LDFGLFHLFEATGQRSEYEMVGEQFALMQAAEDLGFSSVWAAEHHFSGYGICPSPAIALAAAAKITTRMRLGTGIVVLPFHNPIRAAEELAFVDLISGGRLDVGFGRGYRPREIAGFGIDPRRTRSIANEAMEVILQAWTQDEVSYHGEHFQVEGLGVSPKPFQQPHPRTFIGSLSPETFELVGKAGANLLFTPTFRPEEDIPRQIAEYKAAITAHGQDPTTKRIGALRMIYVADTNEQALAEIDGPMQWFYAIANEQNQALDDTPLDEVAKYNNRPSNLDQLLANGNLVAGDPEYVLDVLQKMQDEWNLTDLLLWTRIGGLEVDKVLHSMELFSEHVMPALKSRSGETAAAVGD